MYVGRLAPSPTGALHLGNARTFLAAWLKAREQGGRVILRLEDLDHPKVKAGAAQSAIDDLRWLGLEWDEGPYVQSQRIPLYAEALEKLKAQNLVYPCTCTRADVENGQSAPQGSEDGLFYSGICRGKHLSYAAAQSSLPAGRLPAWRFNTPVKKIAFCDNYWGPCEYNVAESVGDFVIARHPLGAGYMLAVCVDDAAMGVTEVIRGDDLLATTPRQLLIYEALGLKAPQFAHIPLVVSEEGRRLAKRHGDTRIATLRRLGKTPGQVLGLLAWWSGWAEFGEETTLDELLVRFRRSTIPHTPAVLSRRVLDWIGI